MSSRDQRVGEVYLIRERGIWEEVRGADCKSEWVRRCIYWCVYVCVCVYVYVYVCVYIVYTVSVFDTHPSSPQQ